MKESKIQTDTIGILGAHGYLAIPIEYRGRRGCPDLIVFALNRPATVAFVELKTKKGKRSQHQIQNAELYSIWGHEIGLARTPEEALDHVRKVFNGKTQDTAETKTKANTSKAAENAV